MEERALKVELLGRGMAWLDTGNHASMLQASNLLRQSNILKEHT